MKSDNMPDDGEPSPTTQLSDWVTSLQWDDIPDDVRERAVYLTLDGVTCAIVAARLPWSVEAVEAVRSFESPGQCSVIGWPGVKLGPLPAALLNSTLIQGFELDDYHSTAPLHSNSILLPALLSLVNLANAKGDVVQGTDFLTALIAGYEIGPRVGLSLGGGTILARGWHSGAVFGPAASAGSCAKLLGLSSKHTEDAFGMACTQACGLMSAQFESSVKRMQHGFASRNGLFAALMASKSYKGISRVFERPYGGFLSVFGNGAPELVSPQQLTQDLSKTWQTMKINVKPYPAMAGIHATVDALYELLAEEPIDASTIKSIKIEMSEAAFSHGGWKATRPLNVIGAQMNNAYVSAAVLVDGVLSIQTFSEHNIDRDDVWDLVGKTEVVHNQDYDKLEGHNRMCTTVTISFENGEIRTKTVMKPTGVKAPLSNKQIVLKYRQLTKDLISDAQQEEILEKVLALSKSPNVYSLLESLDIEVANGLK